MKDYSCNKWMMFNCVARCVQSAKDLEAIATDNSEAYFFFKFRSSWRPSLLTFWSSNATSFLNWDKLEAISIDILDLKWHFSFELRQAGGYLYCHSRELSSSVICLIYRNRTTKQEVKNCTFKLAIYPLFSLYKYCSVLLSNTMLPFSTI